LILAKSFTSHGLKEVRIISQFVLTFFFFTYVLEGLVGMSWINRKPKDALHYNGVILNDEWNLTFSTISGKYKNLLRYCIT